MPVNHRSNRLEICHIRIGFSEVVKDTNYADSHSALVPFGMKWGRGILIRGKGYLESVTGPYGCSHSQLKTDMCKGEKSEGAFYYGYEASTKTLYLDYASDRTFDLRDKDVLFAIMTALRLGDEPFKDFILTGEK